MNQHLYYSLEKILHWQDSEISKNFYYVKSTFSIVDTISDTQILNFISSEFEIANWYRLYYKEEYFLKIIEYIIGYLNFHFALDPARKDLLNILWQILNNDFFMSIGFTLSLINKNKINSFALERKILDILHNYKIKNFRIGKLDYTTKIDFIKSFMNEYINFLENGK